MRLIDADALLETMENFFTKAEGEAIYAGRRNAAVTWNDAVYMIKTAPTIEPEPDDAEANYWHEKANSYEQTLVKLAQNFAEQPKIIRCKECEDYQTDWETDYPNEHYCATMDRMMPEDGFCCYAERRIDETD